MKKMILSAAIVFSCMLFKTAEAQVNLSVNIGSQPAWGPVGYDRADYYYMPDIDTYYDVPARQYVYYNNNSWVRTSNLPPVYSNYNIYNGYKVVLNDTRNPWERNNIYRAKYAKFKGRHDQVIIRNSNDVKYKKVKGYDNGPGRGNGNGKGHGKGHGKH